MCMTVRLSSLSLPRSRSSPPFLSPVWAEEKGGEGGRGEGGPGAALRGEPDPAQEGHPSRLRGRGGGGRGEHPGHGAQIPARAAAGHVQEVTGPLNPRPHPLVTFFFFFWFFLFFLFC